MGGSRIRRDGCAGVRMGALRRGLVLGIAFGFAAALVELWATLLPFMERRMGPHGQAAGDPR